MKRWPQKTKFIVKGHEPKKAEQKRNMCDVLHVCGDDSLGNRQPNLLYH